MGSACRLEIIALTGIPSINAGDDLVNAILYALAGNFELLLPGDIVVIAQKIVSKAEGRTVRLADIFPSKEAITFARQSGKDERLIELVLRESKAVLRCKPGVIISEHRLGVVLANAGIDTSNVQSVFPDQKVLLLPADPDKSAADFRERLEAHCGANIGVIINDSIGRAWRNGAVGTCLGSAGLPAHHDLRGALDMFGRPLAVSTMGLADELASAASLLQGQGNERRPVVIVRGLDWAISDQTSRNLIRPLEEDMFR